jgi:hypothetical protein
LAVIWASIPRARRTKCFFAAIPVSRAKCSNPLFWRALLASGAEVYDEGVSTTPSISYLVVKEHFDFGVMISASHNPFYDNGIKVFNHLAKSLENEIEN